MNHRTLRILLVMVIPSAALVVGFWMRVTGRTYPIVTTFATTTHAQDAAGTDTRTAAERKYALLVGVSNYRGTEMSNLKYAESDVADLAALFKNTGFRRVVLVTEAEAFDRKNLDLLPTAANIRAHLKSMFDDRAAGDTVVVAFSGHGVELRNGGGLYYCPQKADLEKPDTLVSLTEEYSGLKKCKAAVKLLLSDACRNDPVAGKSATVANLKSLTRPDVPKPPAGVMALFSCSQGEKAYESDILPAACIGVNGGGA